MSAGQAVLDSAAAQVEVRLARVCMIVFNNYAGDPRVRREAEALVERGDVVDCICLTNLSNATSTLRGVNLFSVSTNKYHGPKPLRHVWSYLRFFCHALIKTALLHLQ